MCSHITNLCHNIPKSDLPQESYRDAPMGIEINLIANGAYGIFLANLNILNEI